MIRRETFNAMLDLVNGIYGLSMTGDDVVELGKRILTMELEFNRKAGFNATHDRLPRYFKRKHWPHTM